MSQVKLFSFLLFDGFSNHCLANAVEPLRAANTILGHNAYQWQFVSVNGEGVESSSGLPVSPHLSLLCSTGNLLLVMPSYGYLGFCNYATRRAIRGAAKRFETIAGLDTGSWLLADAGLLDGYRATIHWDEFKAFSDSFTNLMPERVRFVQDRDRITCTGAAATFDMVIDLIKSDHSAALALEVTELFMMGSSSNYRAHSKDRLVMRAIETMRAYLEDPISIEALAKSLGCSQRVLELRVKKTLSITPQKLYRRLRLGQVRKLLQETDLRIAEIALRCGYESPSAMSRAFHTEYNMPPKAIRES